MLCKHCGYEMREGAAFCQKCGAKAAEMQEQEALKNDNQPANEPETVQQPAPEQETPQPEAPAAEAETAEVETAAPEGKKKCKKRAWIIGAIAAVVLVGLLLAAIKWWPELFGPAEGWARKNFGTTDEYLGYVEKKASEKTVNGVVNAYGKYLELFGVAETSSASEVTVALQVGEDMNTLLKAFGVDDEGKNGIDWLKNAALTIDTNAKDSLGRVLMSLCLNNKEIANADLIIGETGIYFALPFMNEQYLHGTFAGNEAGPSAAMSVFSPAVKDALPAKETVAELAEKYSGLVYDSLKNAEKTTAEMEVDGVKQKLTVLTVSVDFDEAKQLVETVLETLAEDAEIKQIIENVAKEMEKNGQIEDADQAYESFLDALKDAKSELKELESDDFFEHLEINFYVNDSHEIVGKKYRVDSDAVSYITVRDGNECAFALKSDELEIEGTGTVKKGVANGTYTVTVEDDKVCEIILQDMTEKDEKRSGKIIVKLADEIWEELEADETTQAALSLLKPTLEIVFTNEEAAQTVEINLVGNEELLVGISFTEKEKEPTEITLPTNIVPEGQEEQWQQSIRIEKLVSKLSEAGVPGYLLQELLHSAETP